MLALLLIGFSAAASPPPELEVYLFNSDASSWEPLDEPILYQGTNYDIAVALKDNVTFTYNVTITIGTIDETYWTTKSMPYITITAPSYTTDENELLITASKEGYKTAYLTVTILKGSLLMTTDRATVQEDESFSVVVTDTDNKHIRDCLIYLGNISSNSYSAITNHHGLAFLPAPAVKQDTYVNIIAVKEGYAAAISQIRIENIQTAFIGDISSEFSDIIPVLLAIGSVIGAIIFVTFRNRQNQYLPEIKIHHLPPESQRNSLPKKVNDTSPPANSISKFRYHPPTSPIHKRNLHSSTNGFKPRDRGPHIEEIRIHVRNIQKETKQIKPKEKNEHLIPRHKPAEYEWYHGTEDIRYKIDTLTGRIDEKQADKWFEGIEEIRCKVDEKVRKKHRK